MPDGPPDATAVLAALAALPMAALATEGPDHRIVVANPASEELLGCVDVIGRTALQVIPEAAASQILPVLDRVHAGGPREDLHQWRTQRGDGESLREIFLDCLAVPWFWPDGRRRGVLVTATDVTVRVRAQDAEHHRASQAEHRHVAARDVALGLQRALLPPHLPVLPAVELSARYLIAAEDQAAGGDWFDAVRLDRGRVALIVGDVVGHGVTAVAAMGQLRVALRQSLHSHDGDIVAAIDDLGWHTNEDRALRATTLCVVVLDPADGSLTYSTSGHPPPLVVGAAGATRYLPPTLSGLLGSGRPAVVAIDTLDRDDVVLLYSDGLIDRADRRHRETRRTLAQVAGDAAADPAGPPGGSWSLTERICAQTVEVLTRDGHHDDVTVLAVRRRAPAPPLDLDVAAERAQVALLRADLGEWLARLPATSGQAQAIALAVTEVAGNVVEHAYREGRGRAERIGLTAELTADGTVDIRISDGGIWSPAPEEGTGRGLWIAGSLVDELRVEHRADGGTTVVLRCRMRRPAHLAAAVSVVASAGQNAAAAGLESRIASGTLTVLTLTGVADASTVDVLTERLDGAGRGGMLALTVDLTAVELLSSAGARALIIAHDRHQRHGTALTLVAEPDGVVADVLNLIGLPRSDPPPANDAPAADPADH